MSKDYNFNKHQLDALKAFKSVRSAFDKASNQLCTEYHNGSPEDTIRIARTINALVSQLCGPLEDLIEASVERCDVPSIIFENDGRGWVSKPCNQDLIVYLANCNDCSPKTIISRLQNGESIEGGNSNFRLKR
jgi:hypothetical protein